MTQNGLIGNKKLMEGIKKVGKGSKFYYRCSYDPTPVKSEDSDETKQSE